MSACVCLSAHCTRRNNYRNNLRHNSETEAATWSGGILPSGLHTDRGKGLSALPRSGSPFAHYVFLVGGVGGKGNSLQSVFKWMFVPVCDTMLSASSGEPGVVTFDLSASRRPHFHQLLVAGSKNLLFISGVIFPSFLFPFPQYAVRPNAARVRTEGTSALVPWGSQTRGPARNGARQFVPASAWESLCLNSDFSHRDEDNRHTPVLPHCGHVFLPGGADFRWRSRYFHSLY